MFTTIDPLHRSVTLKSTTWYNKIINTTGANNNCEHGNSHKEMENLLDDIKLTIEKPLIITEWPVAGHQKYDADFENIELLKYFMELGL